MRQHAWLDFHWGYWSLVAGDAKDRDPIWTHREAALAALREEGWVVSVPHGKPPQKGGSANLHLFGYGLTRIVH